MVLANEKVGVVGAGLMGAEIALVFSLAGRQVTLIDQKQEHLQSALQRLRSVLEKGVARGFYRLDQVKPAFDRIQTDTHLEQLAACQYVTEAVFEDLSVKTSVWSQLDSICPANCIFATNTSTIPISTLASTVKASRRPFFIGTHYFSPVSRMKLVEVIPGFETSPDCVDFTIEMCRALGKTPVRVKDVPGFAVNRVLHAFIIEAVRLVDEGVASPEDIDLACRLGLGHPMGPFELMDAVTSSLCVQAQEIMYEAYGERFRPPTLLKQRVAAGFSGGKGRAGWRR
jgi:3-hydroxybutyryl-CoA dehydrogenase